MKCPECERLDLRSRVNVPMGSMVMAMACPSYYDEDGKYHNHDFNSATSEYSCSQGHRWVQTTRGRCWCGWSGGETTIRILEN